MGIGGEKLDGSNEGFSGAKIANSLNTDDKWVNPASESIPNSLNEDWKTEWIRPTAESVQKTRDQVTELLVSFPELEKGITEPENPKKKWKVTSERGENNEASYIVRRERPETHGNTSRPGTRVQVFSIGSDGELSKYDELLDEAGGVVSNRFGRTTEDDASDLAGVLSRLQEKLSAKE